MNPLRRLAGQTAIYGLGNIIGRLINFLLVPLYTRVFVPGEYGIVTEMYVYVAFLLIVLTYGMETALFRFTQDDPRKKDTIYSTSVFSVAVTSVLFILLVILMRNSIAETLRYPDNVEYVVLLGTIVGLDALLAIPYARLRVENQAFRFAWIRFAGIGVNIGLVLFFLLLCPWAIDSGPQWLGSFVDRVYDPGIGVGYVFISNLAATLFTLFLLLPVLRSVRWVFDFGVWKKMMVYSLPLLVAGLAGWVNEALDKLLLKFLLPESIAMAQVGIYGAVYKLAVLMTIAVQGFRYAAEPFFFAEAKGANARELFAKIMNYFVTACLLIFLGIMLFMPVVKHFVGSNYHEGLGVVPVLLMAKLFLGVYWNLSIWYKLTDKTHYGAWFAVAGAIITVVLNVLLIPRYGYHGSAWAALACYFSLAALSYVFGRKHYPIPYELPKILTLLITALAIFGISHFTMDLQPLLMYPVHVLLIFLFVLAAVAMDPDLRVASKLFR